MTLIEQDGRMMTGAALEAAEAGERLDVDQATALLDADGDRFTRLLAAAAATRDRGLAAAGRPDTITYSRKAFIPLTTLCRDRCHYCVFVDTPSQLAKLHKPAYMSPKRVLTVVRRAAAVGCKEALITLGDRPEDRWPEAREWLAAHGYSSTLDYVAATARMITAETGMLAHLNPGVMSAQELQMLRPVAPSMGMMLETTSRRLFEDPGQVHYGSPDKDPAVRLKVIEDAGREKIPFTTGILIGIGETRRDRAESLIALRDAHERHGHIQEVIVQNFRAKPGTAMRDAPDADMHDYLAAVAVARLVMGPDMRIQVPPNLTDAAELHTLIGAGIDDWGGVSPLTADHVNPERPWPGLDRLAARTAEAGFTLRERLTAHPPYIHGASDWVASELRPAVAALADPATGLAATADDHASPAHAPAATPTSTRAVARLAEAAASDPYDLGDDDWMRLLTASDDDLDALTAVADDVRRFTVGEAVSIVANRNLTTTGLRARREEDPHTFTLDDVAAIAADAAELGASELCIQGRVPASLPASAYLDVVRVAREAAPQLHVHAYRPQDVYDFAERAGLDFEDALAQLRDAGVGTVPGTGVKVLDERVRALIAPGDIGIDRWIAGVTAAHRVGLSSTSVLFYGHVETGAERIAHLHALRAIQESTGGFTEFVPIPLPGPAGGVPLVPGRAPVDEHRAMVAVSRLMLSGAIGHIQIPWTRTGIKTTRVLLRSGGDDLGGTLLDGRVRPQAGVEYGHELTVDDAAKIAAHLFRPFRRRTTTYAEAAR